MDIKSIFSVAIKLIGVYFVFGTTLNVILRSTASLTMNYDDYVDYAFRTKAFAIVDLAFWILMPLFLIFRTDTIIKAFDLVKGFGESIKISFTDSDIMKIGFIFIGGLCIVDHLPTVVTYVIMYVREIASGKAPDYQGLFGGGDIKYRLLKECIGLILGIVAITNYDRLTRAVMPKPDSASL